jgi:hypothetical protein
MSWKGQVQVKGEPGKWHDNAIRLATWMEANEYVRDLYSRWTLTTDYRTIESDDPVNHAWVGGRLKAIEQPSRDDLHDAIGDESASGETPLGQGD